jgi:hypothetical protein
VEGSFDSGPIVVAKMSNVIDDVSYLIARNLDIAQRNLFTREAGLGVPAEVEYNLKEVPDIFSLAKCGGYVRGENLDECFKVVDNLCVGVYQFESLLLFSINLSQQMHLPFQKQSGPVA